MILPTEWSAEWDGERECRAACDEAIPLMAAVTTDRTVHLIHHHADGRVSWRALAACMARLLTVPIPELTDDQKSEAYEHLAGHYDDLGIDPPAPNALAHDEYCELVLDGRLAWLDEHDDAWLYVEPVPQEHGRQFAGLVRIDDESKLMVLPPPDGGPMADHRQWGLRSLGV